MRCPTLVVIALLAIGLGHVSAQENARDRARESMSPQVFQSLDALATEMVEAGIPPEPLFNKALEGLAKRVPSDRLLPAINRYAGQLRLAREAFGEVGGGPLYVAGADALQRGIDVEVLRSLGRREGDSPEPSPMAVLVLADLVEAGIPADRALGVVREALRMRTGEQQMLGMTARVRQMMRQGQSPQEAAEQVRRSLQRGRGGGIGPPVPPGSEPMTKGRRQAGSGRGGGI
jgi:hypothetical protein